MDGDPRIDKLMLPVAKAIKDSLNGKWSSGIYNRAYEAVMQVVEENDNLKARAEAAEKVIRGMFPLWINAMGYCEHGRHSELMAMRNYYNGRDNPMTNEDIHVMFSLIPEKDGN